jgi:hypothetical protein
MEIGGWLQQNWFNLFGTFGVIGSLWFTALSLRATAETQRVANLLALTERHGDLWAEFGRNPGLARILEKSANVEAEPVTPEESEFVTRLFLHLSSVYRAMQADLTIRPDGLREDIAAFFALPVPVAVWKAVRRLQDEDFVLFVERCLDRDRSAPAARGLHLSKNPRLRTFASTNASRSA